MILVVGAMVVIAAAYQLIALAACLRFIVGQDSILRADLQSALPGVSVLKPVHHLDNYVQAAIRSHEAQDYPAFEILTGTTPAGSPAPNRKVGALIALTGQARYPFLVVNDADITVPRDYLRIVTAPLTDAAIGLVTCIYRAESSTLAGRWEALGVATDFAPSTLVAPLAGVSEFGLGSTLAFRRVDLDRIGGFAAIADYLADDYQLGAKLHALGLRNVIAPVVVSTRLAGESWGAVWRHQLRWARTVRLSRFGGYVGLPVTFATLWAVVAGGAGQWKMALALLAVRLIMAVTAGWGVLGAADVLKFWFLIPFRDLYGVAVWAVALFGDTVEWGGEMLKIDREGRILRK